MKRMLTDLVVPATLGFAFSAGVIASVGALPSERPAAICRYEAGGQLPDPVCTPGATNPAVTQRTIRRTICTAGWTRTVRPASLEREKRRSMRAYAAGGEPGGYEYDHLISLQLGGATSDPRNLWPEPYAGGGARSKDVVEAALKRLVCAGAMTLRAAQRAIARDWRVAAR